MPDVSIRIHPESAPAQRDLQRLRNKIDRLQKEFGQTCSAVNRTVQGVDRLGNEATGTSQLVDQFGRLLYQTTIDIDKLSGTTRRTTVGRLG